MVLSLSLLFCFCTDHIERGMNWCLAEVWEEKLQSVGPAGSDHSDGSTLCNARTHNYTQLHTDRSLKAGPPEAGGNARIR